jgi:ornithine cyclodeaminase/alanine dehydrogenase-like protein (mu-crystallin family)
MLVLNGKDLEKAISPAELIEAVEEAMLMYEGKNFNMPPRMHAEHEGNVLLLMPAFTSSVFGTKLVSVFPGNQEKGIPVIQGTMILNDGNSGTPMALMDAAVLTGLRTGAVGAVGVKHLSGRNARNLGIIGAGVQARHLALLSNEARSFDKTYIADLDRNKSEVLAEKLRETYGLQVSVLESGREILEASDVIITATTSMQPVIPGDSRLLEGKTFVGIGSFTPEMREYPDEFYPLLEHVYVDSRQAVEESGDLSVAIESGLLKNSQVSTFGRFLNDPYEIPVGSTNFFKSVGMALFDLVVARKIYESAKARQLGTNIDFP